MNRSIFCINEVIYFEFVMDGHSKNLDFSSHAHVSFIDTNSKTVVSTQGHVRTYLSTLIMLLLRALKNELLYNEDIAMGRIRNDIVHRKMCSLRQVPCAVDFSGINVDVMRYRLWGGMAFESWIYNNALDVIIIELTPFYPGNLFLTDEELLRCQPYEEWIKSYVPLFNGILSRERACKWIKQASDIIDLIDANTASMQKACCGEC